MKKFIVTIEETLRNRILVRAASEELAEQIVMDAYANSEIVLTSDHFQGMESSVEELTFENYHQYLDDINDYTRDIQQRIEHLKDLHADIQSIDDEEAYYGHWINIVADEPTEDDFAAVAEDDGLYEEVVELHKQLLAEFT